LAKNKSADIFRSMKIYMSEEAMYKEEKLYLALVSKLKQLGVPEVIVTHGISGYGKWNNSLAGAADSAPSIPVIVEAIDHSWQISNIMWKIEDMVNKCLVTTTDIGVVRYNDLDEKL